MAVLLCLVGGSLFIISASAHLYVKFRLRPKDEDLEDIYYEFEDQQPDIVKYEKWSRVTFTGAIIGIFMLFISIFILP